MGQFAWQLQKCQWVAAGLGDDPLTHLFVHPAGDLRAEQTPCVIVVQAHEVQHRQSGQIMPIAGVAYRKNAGHRLREKPPRNEGEHLRGGAVEPLRIVDHAHERPALGCLCEQAEHSQAQKEAVRWGPGMDPERRAERVTLRSRQGVQQVQHGRQELMEGCERKLHLGLDPRCRHHAAVGNLVQQIVQQRGLADPRLPAQDQ